jgi:2-polyprenyl-3-methyl-5-hydroxy-6-metoxy-1,4-benzoquinol methylase
MKKMKELLKKITPKIIINYFIRSLITIKFRNMKTNEVFTEIYKSNHWSSSESLSGKGSEIIQTSTLINELNKLIIDFNITSILDIPCGDFNWMQKVSLENIDYLGADIVEELINEMKIKYEQTEKLQFKVLNLISDPLPKRDLIIVRDCLVHLSNVDIKNAIENLKSSGSTYLLTTTFINHKRNHDIVTGNWRAINLQEKPYNFAIPVLIINENCTEGFGEFNDKSMALWEISKL